MLRDLSPHAPDALQEICVEFGAHLGGECLQLRPPLALLGSGSVFWRLALTAISSEPARH
jgi:hypothetical protein